jgi:rare lipoprotein A
MHPKIIVMAVATLLLAACSSTPPRTGAHPASTDTPASAPTPGGYLAGDGPDGNVPTNIDATPDAIPKAEPLHRYANRPYKALGKEYTPLTTVGTYKERGIASWYGKKFHGQRTSIGETYNMYAMSAAHPTLPIPSYARVTNVSTGKSVVVRVNDRGPFMHDRIIDLSYTAAHKLGIIGNGSAEVEVESLAPDAVTSPVAPAEPVQSTPLETPVAATPIAAPAAEAVATTNAAPGGKVYLQLGAFKTQASAKNFMDKMQHKLGRSAQSLSLHTQGGMVRVRLGTYNSADEARAAAEKLHAELGVKPFVSAQ